MAEFKDKKDAELIKLLVEKRKLLHDFNIGTSGSKTRNVKEGQNLKKDIARILTELNTRKHGQPKN